MEKLRFIINNFLYAVEMTACHLRMRGDENYPAAQRENVHYHARCAWRWLFGLKSP